MNRALQLALAVFLALFIAGAISAVIVAAAPEPLRAPWMVLLVSAVALLVAVGVWRRTHGGRSH